MKGTLMYCIMLIVFFPLKFMYLNKKLLDKLEDTGSVVEVSWKLPINKI